MGHLALRGNAFCQISADGSGNITELLPLHPDRMQVELLQNGSYRYLYTDQNGKQIVFMRTEIWHLRGMSNDGMLGLSPIDMARESVGEGLAMQSYSSRFFANDARPGGWVEYDGRFADKGARQTFKESWQENYSGRNLRKVAVLEKGMKYHELTLNNSDAQFVEGRRDKVSEIARVFGVPPHKVGDLSKATFSNIEQQSIEFWTDTMLPWAELWESSIESFILGPEVDLEPEFDMRRMMRGDGAARGTRINQLVMSGVMTPNEGREEESMDPLPGLDQTWRPLNMAPVDEDGDTPATEVLEPPGAQDHPPPKPAPAASRMAALLKDNADRMARRITKGDTPRIEVLAAALAMSREAVTLLLAQVGAAGASEEQLSADLFEAAMRYQQ